MRYVRNKYTKKTLTGVIGGSLNTLNVRPEIEITH
jgi:hypothetical protein